MLPKVINHMTAPGMRYDDFLLMAKSIGCIGVHFRNDLGRPLFEGDAPAAVFKLAKEQSIRITGLAQLYPFNVWNKDREAEARRLRAPRPVAPQPRQDAIVGRLASYTDLARFLRRWLRGR